MRLGVGAAAMANASLRYNEGAARGASPTEPFRVLVELDIRDLAITEHVRVAFGPGLTAITGETGAGKSLIIDALQLLLGGRADASLVRSGATAARVEGVFDLGDQAPPDPLQALLDEAGIETDDGTLIVSREIAAGTRRATARINGRAVVQATLAALGEQLVDIHGQGEHVQLLAPARHVALLDRFAGAVPLRQALAEPLTKLRALRAEMARSLPMSASAPAVRSGCATSATRSLPPTCAPKKKRSCAPSAAC